MSTLAAKFTQERTQEHGIAGVGAKYGPLTGRVLLSAIFVITALTKLASFDGTAGYMAAKGLPFASLGLAGAIALEFFGGLAVLLGYRARIAALALAAFLVPTTLIFHNFWAQEGMQQQIELIMFLKNLAIMGGLVTVASQGSGPLSIKD